MALLPNTKIYGTTGNNSSPTEKIGGVVVGITSATTVTAGSPLTKVFPVINNASDGLDTGNFPVEASGTAHAFSAKAAVSGGTFAYKQSQFMIRGIATKINNITNSAILSNGNEEHVQRRHITLKQKGAKTMTAYAAGYWNPLGISGQRTNWSTAPASANVAYVLPTNNASTADDQAIYVTYRTIPGELVYMYGAINPKQDDYKALTS